MAERRATSALMAVMSAVPEFEMTKDCVTLPWQQAGNSQDPERR
jgi:hypothetical protein